MVCRSLCLSVCQFVSVTTMSPAKMAELIEILFGMWTQVGPRNYVLDGGPDPFMGRDTSEGMTSRQDFPACHPGAFPVALASGFSLHAVNQRSNWPTAEASSVALNFP